MQKIFIASIALLTITGIIFGMNKDKIQSYLTKNLQSPTTVPYVDIDSYLGEWYEQSSIPAYFQKGCINTMAHYSWNSDKKTVRVNNTCIRNEKPHGAIAKAFVEDDTHAKLKVEFIQTLDIGGQYWIVRLGKNYQYSVVSSPNYHYLWILSRQKHMSDALYNAIVQDLRKDNFPVEKLKRTEQN